MYLIICKSQYEIVILGELPCVFFSCLLFAQKDDQQIVLAKQENCKLRELGDIVVINDSKATITHPRQSMKLTNDANSRKS